MSIRILGGLFKGLELSVPRGDRIRPTSVMLRRKLFDSFQSNLPFLFVDCFAGTGSVGLEALSRGVEEVIFIEKDKNVFFHLEKNCAKANGKIEVNYQTVKMPFEKYILKFKDFYLSREETTQKRTVIFFDPPYALHQRYEQLLDEYFFKDDWFTGALWIESDDKKGLSLDHWKEKTMGISKVFEHGDNFICIINF